MANEKSKKSEKKMKELDVIHVETKFIITTMFPAAAMSLYLKPVYVLARSIDGKVYFSDLDINIVKEFAWIVGIKYDDVSFI